MATKSNTDSTFLLQIVSIVNTAYLSMTDLKNSKAPRKTPLKYSRRLMFTSSFVIIAAIYAYSLGNLMEIAIWDFFCVITSINYWRDARYDWRRKLDMIISVPLCFYHNIIACIELKNFQNEKQIFLCCSGVCMGLFSVGLLTNDRKLGQITHSIMHILGSTASVFMYYYLSQERAQIAKVVS